MSNPNRYNTGSNAQERSLEEQKRLIEEDNARVYMESTSNVGVDDYEKRVTAAEYDANAETEARIMENPKANRMYWIAQQIAELRETDGEASTIKDKEDKLQELMEAYVDNTDDNSEKRLEEVDFIVNSTDPEWVKAQLKAAGKNHDPALLSKEDALSEAYDEYEKREGVAYDVDKDREKDIEVAQDTALDEYEKREGAPYDVDKDRIKDTGIAHELAFDEYKLREGTPHVGDTREHDTEAAYDMAVAEAWKQIPRPPASKRSAMETFKDILYHPAEYASARFTTMFAPKMEKARAYLKEKLPGKKGQLALGIAALAGTTIMATIARDSNMGELTLQGEPLPDFLSDNYASPQEWAEAQGKDLNTLIEMAREDGHKIEEINGELWADDNNDPAYVLESVLGQEARR